MPKLRHVGPQLGPSWAQVGANRPEFGASYAQVGPKWAPVRPKIRQGTAKFDFPGAGASRREATGLCFLSFVAPHGVRFLFSVLHPSASSPPPPPRRQPLSDTTLSHTHTQLLCHIQRGRTHAQTPPTHASLSHVAISHTRQELDHCSGPSGTESQNVQLNKMNDI